MFMNYVHIRLQYIAFNIIASSLYILLYTLTHIYTYSIVYIVLFNLTLTKLNKYSRALGG